MPEPDETQGIPLIGDQFPDLEVETTEGTISLPDDYEMYDWWFTLKDE
ncbi:putative peroxiredoxin protein [Halorhabdus tiamatea SARL4B]|uniref:Peroxiredoxin-like protein n=1 Tax=Halorhabdus tiamatea SARL4B TaxID=1033806 RepID=F7PN77_9EURY|nr:hypothetical protein [Halorhabdus tiamatea]ERJ07782.1 putative peroxiredoxin protein [Halorhabdus tiamatea SARL4B]CCQ32560.1 peroxiredoxin-like protein [Halorhabdus tiamatea SARL4B]